ARAAGVPAPRHDRLGERGGGAARCGARCATRRRARRRHRLGLGARGARRARDAPRGARRHRLRRRGRVHRWALRGRRGVAGQRGTRCARARRAVRDSPMPFELFVALRYLREGRMQTLLILCGIGVGVGVIVFLSALIGGLQRSLVASTLGTQPQVVVRPREEVPRVLGGNDGVVRETRVERPAQRVRSITQWQKARDEIAGLAGVTATSPMVSGAAIAVRGGGANAVVVRGIELDSYLRIVPLDSLLVAGRLDLDGSRVIVGVGLAHDLGRSAGDRVWLRVGTTGGTESTVAYTVAGLFDAGNADLNERWVFASLRTAQTLFGLEGGASTIDVKVAEIYEAESLAREIAGRTGLVAESWMATNAQLLTGLRSQGASSVMIQVFVVLAVALGISSVLAVSVVQKSREIGILRATGTS